MPLVEEFVLVNPEINVDDIPPITQWYDLIHIFASI